MDKKEILDILDNAKDERGAVPMRLVRQAFDKLPEQCEDTISRQAAIDAVNNAFDRETLLTGFVRSIAVRAIRDMPSAQPEIIRCKDCKYKGTKNCVANAWTTIFGFGVKDDFYCGLAERRTDG